MSPPPTAALPLLTALLLAGCAGGTDLAGSPEPDRMAARRMLARAAAEGPVPLVVAGDAAPLTAAEIPGLAARGVRGPVPNFSATAADGAATRPRLVVWFRPPATAAGAEACAAGPAASTPAGPPGLLAAWCDGSQAVALVTSEPGNAGRAAAERAVWRATARLFPDDYAETYGFDLFGLRVGLGGSVGL